MVSQMVEVTGDFAHRELELVDCRRGTEVFLGDVVVSPGARQLPQGTRYQAGLANLRRIGGLRDVTAAAQALGTDAQSWAMDVDWRSNFNAACMCEHFYPGSSGLPADQVPAPDQVHGVDAPVTSP